VDVHLVAELTTHPVLHALALAHRDSRRDEAPGGCFVSVRPVHRPEAPVHSLKVGDDGVTLANRGPVAAINVEAQNARDLPLCDIGVDAAVDSSMHASSGFLRQAHSDRLPAVVRKESKVKVPGSGSTFRRSLVPRSDEGRALVQRIVA
jgi:hypothetical protein